MIITVETSLGEKYEIVQQDFVPGLSPIFIARIISLIRDGEYKEDMRLPRGIVSITKLSNELA